MAAHKKTREKIIKHPLFEEFAKVEQVPYWKVFFENCAYGQFKKGISFRDGIIYHKKPRKKVATTCVIPEKLEDAIDVVKKFMYNEIGAMSGSDMMEKQINMSIALKANVLPYNTTWKDIRAPTAKQQLIVLYARNMKEREGLEEIEMRMLVSTINVGLSIEAIKPEDVIMRDAKIVDIKGISRDEEGFFLDKEIFSEGISRKKTPKTHHQTSIMSTLEKRQMQYAVFMGCK